MKYAKPEAGEWLSPVHKGYRLRCCDCGLVHNMDFRVRVRGNGRKDVEFRVFRNNRATAASRRKY